MPCLNTFSTNALNKFTSYVLLKLNVLFLGNRANEETDTEKNKQLVKVEASGNLNELLIKDIGENIEATGVGNKDVDAGAYENDDKPDTSVYKTGVYEIYDELEKRNADAGVYHDVHYKRNTDAGVYHDVHYKRNADAGVYHDVHHEGNADAGVYHDVHHKRNADAGVYHDVHHKRNADAYKRNSRDVLVKDQKSIPLQKFDFNGNEEDVVSRFIILLAKK